MTEPIAEFISVPNTKPSVQRTKLIAALTRCTGLHTSTTCLDCPYRADLNEAVHYGEVSCKDALLLDCHIALMEDKITIDQLVKEILG